MGADRPAASERLAAAVSLASLLAAAVLILVGIVVNLGAVILALAGILVCVTACWYVVARRGVVRIAALVVAVAALAAMVAGFFLANIAIWRVTVIAIVAVLAVATGRHALRRTPRALRSAVSGQPVATPARHPVLIMNLKSGGGKAERYHLAEECRKRGIEPVILRPGDDLLQLAEAAIARGADAIGMAGGDGSQALVATVAARMASRTSAWPPAPATISRSTWDWTGRTWWAPWTPSVTGWSTGSTWLPSMAVPSSTTPHSASTPRWCSRRSTGTPS